MELADGWVRGQPPDDRVLSPAATDDKYSHAREPTVTRYRSGRSCRVWSRRGPTPIALTGAPESSSMALT
jgi:hypothetical protein